MFDREGRRIHSHKYWEVPYRESAPPSKATTRGCQEAFRVELRQAVALRLQADVDVGTYTSGGVDSAVINILAYKDLGHENTQDIFGDV